MMKGLISVVLLLLFFATVFGRSIDGAYSDLELLRAERPAASKRNAPSHANVYSARNVPSGELPPPLAHAFLDDFNVIQIGAGSGGSLLATNLARSGCIKVLVLEEAGEIDWNEERFLPGFENEAYYQPDVEKSFFPKFQTLGGYKALAAMKQIAVHSVIGGAMRLSHFAIEWGSDEVSQREMYAALGNASEWHKEYLWGHINDKYFTYIGANQSSTHANLGKIRSVQSKQSTFQDAWLDDCWRNTNATTSLDFNVIGHAINTCGAEPSNVRADGTRSATENEYLEDELATGNPNLVVVYNAYVHKLLFDYDRDGTPVAVGVDGLFSGRHFSIRFRPGQPPQSNGNQNVCQRTRNSYREVILQAGSIWNPVILQRSGIGAKDLLNKFNISIVKDNANVGAHLKEASSTHSLYRTNCSRADIGYKNGLPSPIVQSRPGAFVTLKGHDFLLLGTPLDFGFARVLFAITFELNQEKEGSLNISSMSPGVFPMVDYNWDRDTLNKHALGLKWYRDLVFNTSFGSKFAMVELDPPAGTVPVTNNAAELAGLATYAKNYLQPVNHISCTTRMAMNESDGVVDRNFKVFGVKQLRIGSQSTLRFVPGAGGQTWCVAVAHNMCNKIFAENDLPLI